TPIQRESAQRRLAQMGGALGVRIVLFDDLNALLLRRLHAGRAPVELGQPVQFGLMRAIVEEMAAQGELEHFAPLAAMPGFNTLARTLLLELEAAQVAPEAFAAFWAEQPGNARVRDIARIYNRWQARLGERNWADRPGMGRLALEALRDGSARLPEAWSPLIFDGFDSFTQTQLETIAALQEAHCSASTVRAQRSADLYITLTGELADFGAEPARRAHRRFHLTRKRLEQQLGCRAEPLAHARPNATWQPPLLHLQQTIFAPAISVVAAEGAVHFVEASNRALEVRAALRWLKQRVVGDGLAPEECALVARTIDPYLPHILQIADEFGLALRLVGGLPLQTSPPVAALSALLRALLPGADGQPDLPRRA
ncbi:MAG: hypothetical protein ACRC1H_07990, partial [Caldilineaceae bacterium]